MNRLSEVSSNDKEAIRRAVAGLLAQRRLGLLNRAMAGLAARLAWMKVDKTTGELYVSITGSFTVGGVSGNGKDVLKLTPSGNGYAVTCYWRGGDHGFNLNIGGIELP